MLSYEGSCGGATVLRYRREAVSAIGETLMEEREEGVMRARLGRRRIWRNMSGYFAYSVASVERGGVLYSTSREPGSRILAETYMPGLVSLSSY